jgi:hypothetical protein
VGIDVEAELIVLVNPAMVSVGSTLMSGILVSGTPAAPGPTTTPVAELVEEADPLAVASMLLLADDPEADDSLVEDPGEPLLGGAELATIEEDGEDPVHCHPMAGMQGKETRE